MGYLANGETRGSAHAGLEGQQIYLANGETRVRAMAAKGVTSQMCETRERGRANGHTGHTVYLASSETRERPCRPHSWSRPGARRANACGP